jgi:hypothetical protein
MSPCVVPKNIGRFCGGVHQAISRSVRAIRLHKHALVPQEEIAMNLSHKNSPARNSGRGWLHGAKPID